MTNRQEVKKLGAYLEEQSAGRYALTSWSPGDGVTRYRIGESYDGLHHDYDGDRALVTALGAAEARVMLKAFLVGCAYL